MQRLERLTGVPSKYALPVALGIAAMLVGGTGETTDIAYHVDFGRDANLLTTPHVLILLGIGGIALAGALSVLLAGPRAAGSLRLAGRDLPAGGAVILLSSGLALAAFPLDGTWHELFGEDLTLWSPTHLLLLGGPTFSLLGMLLLLRQGAALGTPRPLARAGEVALAGLLLFALGQLVAEFAYGVPQFRLLYHPLVVTLAGSFALVLARVLLGRFGALKALAVYLPLAAAPLLIPLLDPGRTPARAPLFVAGALAVELVARPRWRSPLAFGAVAGLAVGTAGLAAEWAWSRVWMPFPWGASLLPEAPLLAAVVGTAAGVLAARVAAAAGGDVGAGSPRDVPRGLAPAAGLALVVALAVLLARPALDARAALAPFDTRDGSTRLRVTLTPRDAAEGADWFRVSVFHGGSTAQVDLRRVAPGTYVTERAFPASGERTATLRLARGGALASLRVYAGGGEGDERPAPLARRSERFAAEHALPPVAGSRQALQKIGYAVLAAIAAAWLGLLGRAVRALERGGGPPPSRPHATPAPL